MIISCALKNTSLELVHLLVIYVGYKAFNTQVFQWKFFAFHGIYKCIEQGPVDLAGFKTTKKVYVPVKAPLLNGCLKISSARRAIASTIAMLAAAVIRAWLVKGTSFELVNLLIIYTGYKTLNA